MSLNWLRSPLVLLVASLSCGECQHSAILAVAGALDAAEIWACWRMFQVGSPRITTAHTTPPAPTSGQSRSQQDSLSARSRHAPEYSSLHSCKYSRSCQCFHHLQIIPTALADTTRSFGGKARMIVEWPPPADRLHYPGFRQCSPSQFFLTPFAPERFAHAAD